MAARYEVLCGDDFMALEDIQWPEGFRPIEQREAVPYAHWWLFEDDDAEPELNGKRVELAIESYSNPEAFGTPEYYFKARILSRVAVN